MAIKDIVKGICNVTRCKYDVYTKEKVDELLAGQIGEVVYENEKGATETVSLTKDITNSKKIEITFKDNNDLYQPYETRIYSNPFNKSITFSKFVYDADTPYLANMNYYVSSTTIGKQQSKRFYLSDSSTGEDSSITIVKVVSYE